jgi:transposase
MTSTLEELETILLVWFKQAHTANTSINWPHLKGKALHVAAHLGIEGFWASDGWIDCFKKIQPGIQDCVGTKWCTSHNSDGLKRRTAPNNQQTNLMLQRWFLPWWNKIKAGGHYSARPQCWWHNKITSTGDWQVQHIPLLKKRKNLPTKYKENSNSWMTSGTSMHKPFAVRG